MSKIGYIRVSTEHQEIARQQEIMDSYQVDRIFSEKISGANTDRPQLRAMLDYVRRMGLSANTFYRRVREYEAEHGIAEPTSA